MDNYRTNKYQTPITEELLSRYPEEVREQFFDYINNVEFIKRLISEDRPYAKDLPRDSKGRIIVDITRPHICENMDYFRQAAIHFEKHGCYTLLRPNSSPQSEYRKFWDEERRRIWEGYVRESDGEWMPGYLYWFMNYCPMMINKITEGSRKALRVEGFPYFHEGIYWRFHYLYQARELGENGSELSKRGSAKSYSLASIMTHNLILGESTEADRRVNTVLTAYPKEYLKVDKDGTFAKFSPALSFLRDITPFPNLMLKNSPNEMSWIMGYKNEYGIEKGSRNSVMGVSAKDDPDKLRGKRGWILYEEMGTFAGLLALYDTTRKSVEDGDFSFAMQYLVGTANESESDFSSAKTLLYNPEGYRIHAVDNVYDKPNQGKDKFGFFFPSYINRLGCYNHDGTSDVVKALLEILMNRYNAKYSADPKSLLRVIAEDPITPSEAMIKVKNAFFPVTALGERLLQLDQDPKAFDGVYVGDLVLRNGKVEFSPSNEYQPIHKYGVENTTRGALEIFEMPQKTSEGKVFPDRYIIGHDPVDNDAAESSSLSSTFVFDLFTDRIVAEFTGRFQFADDNFEMVRLLSIFYNAKVMYESNKKGCYAYFLKMGCSHMLADTPQYLRDKQLIKYTAFGSNQKGINASAAINNYANDLIRDWLCKVVIVSEGEEGERVEMPLLYTLKNRALIEELIAFSPQLNVDRIRALGMVMLYREEKIILYKGDIQGNYRSSVGKDYLGNDSFFDRNYRKGRPY